MSLRKLFYALIRKHMYDLLKTWRPGVASFLYADLYSLIDETMDELSDKINNYIASNQIGLSNIEHHAEYFAGSILLKYIILKRVD